MILVEECKEGELLALVQNAGEWRGGKEGKRKLPNENEGQREGKEGGKLQRRMRA